MKHSKIYLTVIEESNSNHFDEIAFFFGYMPREEIKSEMNYQLKYLTDREIKSQDFFADVYSVDLDEIGATDNDDAKTVFFKMLDYDQEEYGYLRDPEDSATLLRLKYKKAGTVVDITDAIGNHLMFDYSPYDCYDDAIDELEWECESKLVCDERLIESELTVLYGVIYKYYDYLDNNSDEYKD